jgi:predicted acylesterase/phospholipase RssA
MGLQSFVCTVRQKSTRPTALRSYFAEDNMDSIYKICKVWEAVRATAAATTFFDPIQIGKYGETFVDGGVKENNPIARAEVEARRLWPEQKLVITSIGTGTARIESFEGNLVTIARRLKAIATDCDEKWESFVATNKAMRDEGRLFRFTATGLEDVVLDEVGQKDLIADRTNSYLENGLTKEELENCKKALLGQENLGS